MKTTHAVARPIAIAVAATALSLAGLACGQAVGGAGGSGGSEGSGTSTPITTTYKGLPTTIEVLHRDENVTPMGISLTPPTDMSPAVDGMSAIVDAGGDAPKEATSIDAKLASFTSDQFGISKPLLVWVISYEGTCVPIVGPPAPPGADGQTAAGSTGCAGHELDIVVDASSGGYEFSYSYR